jgi:hypothetical protein
MKIVISFWLLSVHNTGVGKAAKKSISYQERVVMIVFSKQARFQNAFKSNELTYTLPEINIKEN